LADAGYSLKASSHITYQEINNLQKAVLIPAKAGIASGRCTGNNIPKHKDELPKLACACRGEAFFTLAQLMGWIALRG
jgi:hypothetical protein